MLFLAREKGGPTNEDSHGGQHGPSPMDELAFSEALQSKHLIIRLQGIAAELGLLRCHLADQSSSLVDSLVLVKLIQIDLQELARLC